GRVTDAGSTGNRASVLLLARDTVVTFGPTIVTPPSMRLLFELRVTLLPTVAVNVALPAPRACWKVVKATWLMLPWRAVTEKVLRPTLLDARTVPPALLLVKATAENGVLSASAVLKVIE